MFPIKDNLRCSSPATVTTWLIVLNVLAFLWEVGMLVSGRQAELFGTYLMVPHDFFAAFATGTPADMAWACVTVFASMFLHGSFGHIFGNMFFLYIFGKGMENRLGKWWYLAFYLFAGVAAALCHAFSDPSSTVPTLGASGAIAGVLGGYLLLWPTATISGFYVAPAPAYVHTKAYWFLVGWMVMQFSGVLDAIGSVGSGVAYWAHIGGFISGFILAAVAKIVQPVSEVCIVHNSECDTPADKAKEAALKKGKRRWFSFKKA
jgi:membrane associated rhomboid family serine protease